MYEILCLISSKIDKNQLEETINLVKNTLIQDLKGEIVSEKILGEKKLSYPIKKEKRGFYWLLYFNLSPQKVKKFEEKLKNIPEILRFLIVKKRKI
jgi:small subunit ribosomal protein S6